MERCKAFNRNIAHRLFLSSPPLVWGKKGGDHRAGQPPRFDGGAGKKGGSAAAAADWARTSSGFHGAKMPFNRQTSPIGIV